jgi:hypothetical protein
MMLLIIIAWILVVANAPWYMWLCFTTHILGSFVAWVFKDDRQELLRKFKE